MILTNKTAIIYGAGGSIGGAVAMAFAGAGAKVFVTGHHIEPVQELADKILAAGGWAEAALVDALDENTINIHINDVINKTGAVGISFNAVGRDIRMNEPMINFSVDEYVEPITTMMRTRFLTAQAAAKIMMKQGSGVILTLTATPGGIGYPYTGGFAPACAAVEKFSSNLAAELGVYGVRVVNIRSGGSPDSKVFKQAIDSNPEVMAKVMGGMEDDTMLKQLPLMSDIANVAVFLCSGLAAKITGVTVDVTSGTTAGLNYRANRLTNK